MIKLGTQRCPCLEPVVIFQVVISFAAHCLFCSFWNDPQGIETSVTWNNQQTIFRLDSLKRNIYSSGSLIYRCSARPLSSDFYKSHTHPFFHPLFSTTAMTRSLAFIGFLTLLSGVSTSPSGQFPVIDGVIGGVPQSRPNLPQNKIQFKVNAGINETIVPGSLRYIENSGVCGMCL
jgi:hypothetical protein